MEVITLTMNDFSVTSVSNFSFDLILPQCQLSELSQQMGDQSEYCSSMGAAVCTLLWRVSRQQHSVTSLLGGVCKCLVLKILIVSESAHSLIIQHINTGSPS